MQVGPLPAQGVEGGALRSSLGHCCRLWDRFQYPGNVQAWGPVPECHVGPWGLFPGVRGRSHQSSGPRTRSGQHQAFLGDPPPGQWLLAGYWHRPWGESLPFSCPSCLAREDGVALVFEVLES